MVRSEYFTQTSKAQNSSIFLDSSKPPQRESFVKKIDSKIARTRHEFCNRVKHMDVERLSELEKLIREILADAQSGREKCDHLDDEVAYFEKLLEREEMERSSRVVRLDRYRQARFPLSWGGQRKNAETAGSPDRISFFSGEQESNWRRTVDLHHDSGRYALVNFHDISREVWASADSARNLGPVTVFIPELTDLTVQEQEQIFAIARQADGAGASDGPHFVLATTHKLQFTN